PPCEIGLVTLDDGLEVMLVLRPLLYEREGTPYMDDQGNDWPDNHLRFARLCLAAAEIAGGRGAQGWQPGLVHADLAGMTPGEFEHGLLQVRLATADADQTAARLEPGKAPLFAVVSRLVQQKGIDLTLEISDALLQA
ncbi:glycogen/starch synthase, partial [Pseudomonas aeruginosa]